MSTILTQLPPGMMPASGVQPAPVPQQPVPGGLAATMTPGQGYPTAQITAGGMAGQMVPPGMMATQQPMMPPGAPPPGMARAMMPPRPMPPLGMPAGTPPGAMPPGMPPQQPSGPGSPAGTATMIQLLQQMPEAALLAYLRKQFGSKFNISAAAATRETSPGPNQDNGPGGFLRDRRSKS